MKLEVLFWMLLMRLKLFLPSISKLMVLPVLAVVLFFVTVVLTFSCTTNHYFSVNADEMTNPRIEYHDSTSVTNPF